MLNYSSTMLGSHQHKILADFYEKVFEKKPDMNDGDFIGWMVGNTFFGIGAHSEIKGEAKEPQRVMFNFETKEVQKEFERIKSLGAKVIKEPYDAGHGMMIATFADPDGNFFQLMPPWEA